MHEGYSRVVIRCGILTVKLTCRNFFLRASGYKIWYALRPQISPSLNNKLPLPYGNIYTRNSLNSVFHCLLSLRCYIKEVICTFWSSIICLFALLSLRYTSPSLFFPFLPSPYISLTPLQSSSLLYFSFPFLPSSHLPVTLRIWRVCPLHASTRTWH